MHPRFVPSCLYKDGISCARRETSNYTFGTFHCDMSNYQSHGDAETFALVARDAEPSEQALSDVQEDPPQKEHKALFGAHRTGLIVSYLIAITSIIFGGIAAASWGGGAFQMNPVPREIIALIIEALVTVLTETLGSIHGTSLRWALYHENRLEFNTNLRLFTFAQHKPNSIISNAVFLLCTAICYAAGSLVLVSNTVGFYEISGHSLQDWNKYKDMASVSPVALISLGIAALVLCMLSTWCVLQTGIPTWSSSPFATIEKSLNRGVQHQDGRCMMSVHDLRKPSGPTPPHTRQRSVYTATSKTQRVLLIILSVFIALVIWTGIIAKINSANNEGKNWNIFAQGAFDTMTNGADKATQNGFTPTVFVKIFTKQIDSSGGNPDNVPEIMMLGVLFFRTGLQSIITIGLHCVEVLVGMDRDEQTWRTLASKSGSIGEDKYDSIPHFLKSWEYMTLFLLKPIIHWMFGQAVGFDYAKGVLMRLPHLTYLSVLWILLLAFAGFLSFRSPKGELPASYGNLQVMADVIDQWTPKMYWGDKGVGNDDGNNGEDTEVRHAGTSDGLLSKVHLDALYA